jgi:chromosome segregation protein
MQAREAKLSEQLAALTEQRDELLTRRAELEGALGELERIKSTAADERQELEQRLVALRQGIVESERSLDRERNALAQQRGRLKALEEMRARREGVGDGVKNLLAKNDPTLLGLVVDRVQAPAEVTAALAGLLGGMLECVVVSDRARAVELLGELAVEKKGRVSVVSAVPCSTVAPDRPASEPLTGEGVLGPLLAQLSCEPEDYALIAALVGDAVLVETPDIALALAPSAAGRALVALDGTVVHPDGRITGGSGETVVSGLVDEQREMRDLREVCAALIAKVESEVAAHEALREQMIGLSAALEHARQSVHAAEIALVSSQKDAKKTDEQLTSLEHRLSASSAELGDIGQKLAESGSEQADAERALREGEEVLREAELEAEGAVATAAAWREQVASQLSIVTDKKVRLARVREQAASTRSTVERLARSHGELVAKVATLTAEIDELTRQSEQTRDDLTTTETMLHEASQIAESTQATHAETRRLFDEARSSLSEREGLLKGLRARVSELADQLSAEELTLERLSINKEHLLGTVRERFRGLELGKVVGDYHLLPSPDQAHSQRISELSHLIDRMGPVNLDATREHREEKERLVFYLEQKADLEKALEDLRRAITQMNRESKRLFRETYDSINERFKVLFPKLFNGGRAELHLTNPDDLLETGVEIVAQPPGKKLGNIELMSGGEKALTAVSLIFAIFQHKPSPFCILDEVDAPLDEANVTRYNEMIREMTDRSQFILITHIKRTMQSVDVLYGVTMQEAGISRLVSVKINESAQRRSNAPLASPNAEQVQVA